MKRRLFPSIVFHTQSTRREQELLSQGSSGATGWRPAPILSCSSSEPEETACCFWGTRENLRKEWRTDQRAQRKARGRCGGSEQERGQGQGGESREGVEEGREERERKDRRHPWSLPWVSTTSLLKA
jgi:hypothetical protein